MVWSFLISRLMIWFLAKGLLRDRSRSLFPLLTCAIGVALVVLMDAYLRGATDSMFKATASFVCGHLRVTTRAYARAGADATNELAIIGLDSLLAELRRDFPSVTWTPRIRFSGLIDVPDKNGETRIQSPAAGLAVDLSPASPEHQLLRLAKSLAAGRLPSSPGEALVADDFARRLGLRPGDRFTYIGSTMNGSLATYTFTLAGTIRFGISLMDRGAVLADIRDAQQALDMADAADMVLGFLPGSYDDRLATQLASRYKSAATDDYAPVIETMRQASGMGSLFDIMALASALIIGIFVTAMAVVLWNAGLMSSLRRYGEIGLRLAIGESKGHVYRSLLVEAFLVGLVGSAIGTIIGLGFSYYLQEVGINIAGMMPNATVVIDDILRARIGPLSTVIGFVPGLLATFIGAAISGLGVFRRQTAFLIKELGA